MLEAVEVSKNIGTAAAAGNTMFYKAAVCRSLPEKQSV